MTHIGAINLQIYRATVARTEPGAAPPPRYAAARCRTRPSTTPLRAAGNTSLPTVAPAQRSSSARRTDQPPDWFRPVAS